MRHTAAVSIFSVQSREMLRLLNHLTEDSSQQVWSKFRSFEIINFKCALKIDRLSRFGHFEDRHGIFLE